MLFDLLNCIADSHGSRDAPRHVTENVEQTAINIDLDDHLVEDGSRLVTQLTRHLLALEDLTWELVVTDGTRTSVRERVTVRGVLSGEVPPLHDTTHTFTLGNCLHINKLADVEVSRSEAIADGEEVLWGHNELSEMSLGWEVVLEEVTSLGLVQILQALLTDTDLDGVNAILLLCLDLGHLAAVNLEDGACHDLTPLVPEVCHANFVSKEAHALAVPVGRDGFLKLILGVNLVLERSEGAAFVPKTMEVWVCELTIINDLGQLQVLCSDLMNLGNCKLVFAFRGCRGCLRFGSGCGEVAKVRKIEGLFSAKKQEARGDCSLLQYT